MKVCSVALIMKHPVYDLHKKLCALLRGIIMIKNGGPNENARGPNEP